VGKNKDGKRKRKNDRKIEGNIFFVVLRAYYSKQELYLKTFEDLARTSL
jgi:hypothetical protein